MQLYLCRHGETKWSLSGQHTGKTDIPLTDRGKRQAAFLRKRIESVHFEGVFSSPKIRAVESCEGLPAVLDSDIVEWDYGDYEGLTTAEIDRKRPGWNLFRDGAPGGESLSEVGRRSDRFLKKVCQYKGNVAAFSHGHFLRVLAARFLGLEPDCAKLFSLSVASLSILGYERDQPVILLWNEKSGGFQ